MNLLRLRNTIACDKDGERINSKLLVPIFVPAGGLHVPTRRTRFRANCIRKPSTVPGQTSSSYKALLQSPAGLTGSAGNHASGRSVAQPADVGPCRHSGGDLR